MASEPVSRPTTAFANDSRFTGLELAFDAGGMIADAMNEGKPTPINIRIESNSPEKARKVAQNIQKEVDRVPHAVTTFAFQWWWNNRPRPSFLNGTYYPEGYRWFFPELLLMKLPVPIFVLPSPSSSENWELPLTSS